MLAMLSHQLETFQDTLTHSLPKGQAGSGQQKAGPVGGGGTSLVCVFQHQEMLLEGRGEQAILDLSLANYVLIYKTAATLFSCQAVNPSRQVQSSRGLVLPHLPSAS